MTQFSVPDLPYEYGALAPAISEAIMKLHHDTHHQAYVTKLNAALTDAHVEVNMGDGDQQALEGLLSSLNSLPESTQTAVRNNGGGHYNHSLFWRCMCAGGNEASGDLRGALEDKYGSFEAFKDAFTEKALGLFGSGWVWLQPNLDIIALPNQDNPIMEGGDVPLLGLDVWEHAYYLDYHASRKDYVDAWWGVVDWHFVERRYATSRD